MVTLTGTVHELVKKYSFVIAASYHTINITLSVISYHTINITLSVISYHTMLLYSN